MAFGVWHQPQRPGVACSGGSMMAASGKPAEEHAPNGNQIMDDGHGGSQVQPSPGECVPVEGTLWWKLSEGVLWVAHRATAISILSSACSPSSPACCGGPPGLLRVRSVLVKSIATPCVRELF